MKIITVTVSDTRTAADDESGTLLDAELAQAGFEVVRHVIVKDEPAVVQELVRGVAARREADALVLSGGTGLAPRDRTYEALEAVFDKRMDGFGEAFRRLSWDEIGPRAILSRATAGVVGPCVVFSLPGSKKAVSLGVRMLVAPVIAHAVDLAQGRTSHGDGHPKKTLGGA
jgi:molybdenum cofactor biosynthesis protein B